MEGGGGVRDLPGPRGTRKATFRAGTTTTYLLPQAQGTAGGRWLSPVQ